MIELDEILRLAARMNSDDPGADFDAALDRLTTAELRDVMSPARCWLAGPCVSTPTTPTPSCERVRWRQCPRDRDNGRTVSSSIHQRRNECFRTCDKLRQAARILNRINGNDKMPCPTCG